MATLSDIKNGVADQLGTGNGSTSVAKRDRIINRARRVFYSVRQWSFLRKSTTISFTAQVGSLPADFNNKFDPIEVYTYSSDIKYVYDRVNWDDVQLYSGDSYVYAIDRENDEIKINQSTVASLTMDYTHLPADKAIDTTDDTDIEPTDDVEPIILLSIAMWWLSSERDDGKHQMFMDEYNALLSQAIRADSKNEGIHLFNKPYNYIGKGYRGKGW